MTELNRSRCLKLLRQQNLYLIEQDQRADATNANRLNKVKSNVRLIRQLLKGQVSTELCEAYRSLNTSGPYQAYR